MGKSDIEKLLINDWASGLRITTVPQAMGRLGLADDPDLRWEITNPMDGMWHSSLETPEKVKEVHSAIGLTTEEEEAGLSRNWGNQVGSWDKASILPTDNEKLIDLHILYCQKIQTRVAVARRHSSRPWRRTGRDRQRNSNASPAGLLNSRRRPTSEHLLFGRRPR